MLDAIPNLLYVRDGSGALGVVDVVWGGSGWEIGASPVDSPVDSERLWPVGVRVISR